MMGNILYKMFCHPQLISLLIDNFIPLEFMASSDRFIDPQTEGHSQKVNKFFSYKSYSLQKGLETI